MDISLDELNPGAATVVKWEQTWNRAATKRPTFGFVAKTSGSLVDMLNFSVVELYPSGFKAGVKPLLVTSNEKLFQLVMMSKNQFDKVQQSKNSMIINGSYVDPKAKGDDIDNPKWVKTRNLVTGEYVFVNVKSHTLTGRGIVIPHPMISGTIDDDYMKTFSMIIRNIRDKKQ